MNQLSRVLTIFLALGRPLAGEVIAISFRGRLNSRSFGRATGGYSTANTGYTMPDSAMIVLTAAVDADRTGQIYGGPVWPDESVGERTADESDPVLDAALRWLASSRPCAAARQGR
jgi:carboxyl-terminal processing protease